MKFKTILAAIILTTAAVAMTTSAFAGGFCEVPKVLKEDKTYDLVMTTQELTVKVLDIDDDACWVKVQDEARRVATGNAGKTFYLSIRQMVAIIPYDQK